MDGNPSPLQDDGLSGQETHLQFWKTKSYEAEESFKTVEILDEKYEVPDLEAIVSKQKYLSSEEKVTLLAVLSPNESLFQANPGKWQGPPVEIESIEGVKPQNSAPYRIPQAHLKAMRKEVDRLVSLKVLRPVQEFEWAAPSFVSPRKMTLFVSSMIFERPILRLNGNRFPSLASLTLWVNLLTRHV